ncbi:hypothetical protein [Actinomadura macra]|uniref:hypothetical protein n=1 Tax=Actinomadura macra TaxID=46164 RepID=UPI0008365C79|nr:hypothetical protein [Actinomadura macra]
MSAEALDAAEGLAKAAYFESLWVAVVIPAAIPIVPIIYQAQGNPGKLWRAADGWKDMVDQLEKSQQKIEELSRLVAQSQWAGDDRVAFEKKMNDYSDQIDFAIAMAWSVIAALYVLAVLIGIFIYLMFVIMTLLTIFATAIVIAAGTIVGAPAALELEAQANQFASMAYRVLSVGSKVIEKTSTGVAYIWSALLAINMTGQAFNGNTDVLTTFVKAGLNGADDMLKGALAYLLTKRTAEVFGANPASRWGVPLSSRVAPLTTGEKLAAGLGTADTLDGSNVLATPWANTGDSYGSEDDAGRKYVDETQPHR